MGPLEPVLMQQDLRGDLFITFDSHSLFPEVFPSPPPAVIAERSRLTNI